MKELTYTRMGDYYILDLKLAEPGTIFVPGSALFSVLEKFSRCHNLWIFHARFQKIFIAG